MKHYRISRSDHAELDRIVCKNRLCPLGGQDIIRDISYQGEYCHPFCATQHKATVAQERPA